MSTPANQGFEPAGSVAVVTGGTGGIGAALARALASGGAAVVVIADLDEARTTRVAARLQGEFPDTTVVGHALDVADRRATVALLDRIESDHGPIDLLCANAGIGTGQGVEADPAVWQQIWEVNVMAHVHVASAMLPRWQARDGGHLLITASAAGLLTNLGDAPYSVTKHAAVAFAEWVAITHGDEGINVTCLCPQGVRTPMLFGAAADEFADEADAPSAGSDLDTDALVATQAVRQQGVLEPSDVARAALAALAEGRFLALPHEEVARYEQARTGDHDRWIRSMRRLQAGVPAAAPAPD